MNYEQLLRRAIMLKRAATVLTPEAQQLPPQGAPMDPSMMQQMPPQGAPMDPSMMQQLPPEVYQDPQFQQMLAQIAGIALNPNTGTFVDVQSGQPVPPDYIMQAWQAYQQQQQAQGMQQGVPVDPAMQDPYASQMPQEMAQPAEDPKAQLQQMVDETVQRYTEGLEKKVDDLSDTLKELLEAVQSLKDTNDTRAVADRDVAAAVRDEIARELQPTVKTASRTTRPARVSAPKPLNMFDLLRNNK